MPTQPRQDKLKDVLNIKSPVNGSSAAVRKPQINEATVDIGALMRKAMAAPKLRPDAQGAPPAAAPPAAAAKPPSTSIEFRGNPIYSPNDSLAKAAAKLATLKAAGATPGPAPAAARKPRPSDAATPGWRPEAEGMRAGDSDEIPLAARTLMAKRNRRKSVYQRPTRYGDWFDGDDEELEKRVEDHNGDEEAAQAAHETAKAARRAAGEQEDAAAAARQQKDRVARRKSAFPALGQREAVAAELAAAGTPAKSVATSDSAGTRGAPTPVARGTDIVNKVRAIADGLCERLDGLIEESPALPRGAQRDEKSLRDKLLESWEGRSYYDRLMQMAGGAAEQEELKEELAAASVAAPAAKDPTPEPEAPSHAAALSFLSPPKPKLRADVAAALKAATAAAAARPKPAAPAAKQPAAAQEKPKEKPAAVQVAVSAPSAAPQQPAAAPLQVAVPAAPAAAPTEVPRGPSLLKVSARGTKPMPAPWQTQQAASTEPTAGKKDPTPSPAAATSAAAQTQLAAQTDEIAALRAALAEANAAREEKEQEAAEARAEAEAARATLAAMEEKLEEAEEDAKTEATVRAAAEKRMHAMEAEIEALQAAGGAAEGAGKALGKVAEDAAAVEGKFGLMEIQLETLMTAAESLATQLAAGKGAAAAVVEAAQAAVAGAGDAAPALRRTRRKSAWRG